MGYLINSGFAFTFKCVHRNDDVFLALAAIDLESKESVQLVETKEIGFLKMYDEIIEYIKVKNYISKNNVTFDALIVNINYYTSNLYGLYLEESALVKNEWLQFFKEAYVSFFALEMASFFSKLSDHEKLKFEAMLDKKCDCEDDGYSEILFLRMIYTKWKLIQTACV